MAVDAPIGHDKTLSYSIPPWLDIQPGQMVWVPLGSRPVQGIVFQLADRPQVDVTRDVLSSVEPSPLISDLGLKLARWISRYYLSPLFDSVALMLPPGFESRVRSYVRVTPHQEGVPPGLSSIERETLEYLASRGEVGEREIARALGRDGERELHRLLRKGLLQRRWELPRPKVSHKYDCYIRPAGQAAGQVGDKAPRQTALYRALTLSEKPIPLSLVSKEYGMGVVSGLLAKGLLALEWIRVEREPALQRQRETEAGFDIILTPEQERALSEIAAALEGKPGAPGAFLLHGVTGSGKTEVYLRALERCVTMGRKGIFLVPEIALTPQTVHRLNARFPGRVALLHSGLSLGEQFDQWWKVKDGDYDVVAGPRSALFAPLPDLGLIVVDEEHEWTYKQQDITPRYHAREVSLQLGELAGAVVVMGTATPDVVTYYRANRGEYRLLELPRRIAFTPSPSPTSGCPHPHPLAHELERGVKSEGRLAQVEVCDMRQELKEGNRSIFSRALATALSQCIEREEQAVLFLNRRGTATLVQCRDCGFVVRCRRCSVTMTYHAADMRLLCHQCNRRSPVPRGCSQCRSSRIRYLGLGTQRVMEELKGLLPDTAALRWDRDTAHVSQDHESIMGRFLRGEAQVLVGTQMVAKGLHIPNVSLVGVVLADIGLNLPDFRAGERAFQLLCQVAGRAGRGPSPGKVIIQTYNPTSYPVEAAAAQDYRLLYIREIQFRQQQGTPPFSRLIHMTYLHTNAGACQREAERMGRALRQTAYSSGLTDVEVVGPAPAFPERVRGRYRWHVILRGWNLHSFLEDVTIPQGWTVDVDPVTVL